MREKLDQAQHLNEQPPFTPASTEPRENLREYFDWFAIGACRDDENVAQRWYRSLVAVAPIFRYTKAIRVLLHDDEPRWVGEAGILMIPRSWTPNTRNAFALFAVVVTTHPIV